jgi:hypothetical protein
MALKQGAKARTPICDIRVRSIGSDPFRQNPKIYDPNPDVSRSSLSRFHPSPISRTLRPQAEWMETVEQFIGYSVPPSPPALRSSALCRAGFGHHPLPDHQGRLSSRPGKFP